MTPSSSTTSAPFVDQCGKPCWVEVLFAHGFEDMEADCILPANHEGECHG